MQNMSWQERGYGYRGGWGPRPGFFILPMILMGVLFFTVLKFLWPLLLLGAAFMIVRKVMIHHMYANGERGEWTEQQREWMRNHRFGWPGERGEGHRHGFGPRGHFGHHGEPGEQGERSERSQWGHGRHGGHGGHGPWGWDSNQEQPKRKNEDDGDDKPKRDGNTLYV
ncbi:MAG: hypothetical protein ABI690_32260 [Chloroflexota bacterium]